MSSNFATIDVVANSFQKACAPNSNLTSDLLLNIHHLKAKDQHACEFSFSAYEVLDATFGVQLHLPLAMKVNHTLPNVPRNCIDGHMWRKFLCMTLLSAAVGASQIQKRVNELAKFLPSQLAILSETSVFRNMIFFFCFICPCEIWKWSFQREMSQLHFPFKQSKCNVSQIS